MISAAALFENAADLAQSAIEWSPDYPGHHYAPGPFHSSVVHRNYAIDLLEWASEEDYPDQVVTIAIGQLDRLSRGGSHGDGWKAMLMDTVDVCRDMAIDLREVVS